MVFIDSVQNRSVKFETMKKSLRASALIAVGLLLLFSVWPSNTNVENAKTLITKACGLEKSNGNWEFVNGKIGKMEWGLDNPGFPDEALSMSSVTSKDSVLALRAALLDSRWFPIANAISDVAVFIVWNEGAKLSTEGRQFRLNGETQAIKAYNLCQALRENRNS